MLYNFRLLHYCGQVSYNQYVDHPKLLATRTHCRKRWWARRIHASLRLHHDLQLVGHLGHHRLIMHHVKIVVIVRDMGMGMMPRLSRVDVFMTALSIIRASAFARS